MDGVIMTPHVKWSIAGIVLGLILLAVFPWWVTAGIVVLAIGIPAAAYLSLDPSQRRRYRELRRRKALR
jgi:cell division protein FtsW (lipid II flippase)